MGLRIGMAQLDKRKDRYYFERFAFKVKHREERIEYLISCFLLNQNAWIGEIFDDACADYHSKRMRYVSSIDYHFRNECATLIEYMEENSLSVKDFFLTNDAIPRIITDRHRIIGGISDETLALIDKGLRFCEQKTDDPFWQRRSFVIAKYKYLLDISNDVLKVQLNQIAARAE